MKSINIKDKNHSKYTTLFSINSTYSDLILETKLKTLTEPTENIKSNVEVAVWNKIITTVMK